MALVAAVVAMLVGCTPVPGDMPDATSISPTPSDRFTDDAATPISDRADVSAPSPEPTASVAGISVSLLDDEAEVPEFETPWEAEFTEAYLGSTSDLQREILEDGQITEDEADELRSALQTCLAEQGFTDVTFYGAGAFAEQPPAGMSNEDHYAIVSACHQAAWGDEAADVYYLYYRVERNPDHEDETDIMAACLVRAGLVETGYSGEDYADDAANDEHPFDTSAAQFQDCLLSPLPVDG